MLLDSSQYSGSSYPGGMGFPAGIAPSELAFDIDGVVADTMEVFLRLARGYPELADLRKEHLRVYDLHKCVPADGKVIDDLICTTLDDEHTLQIPPMEGAPEVLTELARHGPLRFVTARIWPESIIEWLHNTLPDVDPGRIEVIATGSPEAKLGILRDLRVRCFLEDRLETCRLLAREGFRPILFDQPWNRGIDLFPRVRSWRHFQRWIKPENFTETGKHL